MQHLVNRCFILQILMNLSIQQKQLKKATSMTSSRLAHSAWQLQHHPPPTMKHFKIFDSRYIPIPTDETTPLSGPCP